MKTLINRMKYTFIGRFFYSNWLFANRYTHIAVMDTDFYYVKVNYLYAKQAGLKPKDLIGKYHFDVYPDEEDEKLFKKIIQTKERCQFYATPHVFSDDPEQKKTYWDWTVEPVLNKSKEVEYLVFTATNVTNTMKREVILNDFFESSHDIFLILSYDGTIKRANRGFINLFKYTDQEIINEKVKDVFQKNFCLNKNQEMKTLLESFLLEKPFQKYDVCLKEKDGTNKCVSWSAMPFPQKKEVYIVGRDMTQLKKVQEDNRIYRKKMSEILDDITDAFFSIDKEWRLTACNKKIELITGMHKEELLGRKIEEIFPKNMINICMAELRKVREENQPRQFEAQFKLNGENVWFEYFAYVKDEGLSIYFHEITERKRIESELQEVHHQINDILDHISDAFITLDHQYRFTYLNRAALNFLNFDHGNIIGKNLWDKLPKEVFSEFHQGIQQALLTQRPHYFQYYLKFSDKYFDVHVYPSSDIGLSIFFSDITGRKRTEKELEESEERFSKAFHDSPIMMSIRDLKTGSFIDVNECWLKYTGYTREEMLEKNAIELNLPGDDKSLDITKNTFLKPFSGLNVCYKTKSGQLREGILSNQIVVMHGKECTLVTLQDVTEQRCLEKELARLDRLNLIGQMGAGIGHEIRNPMTTIRGFLQIFLMKEQYQNDKKYLELMISEIDRANTIISEFLTLSKTKCKNLVLHNLNKVIETLQPLIIAHACQLNKRLEIELEDVPDILMDEKEIKQLILNLVQNSFDVTPAEGIIWLKTKSNNTEVVLIVKDEGTGIPDEVLSKLGTPFITTKETGTGLGLAIIYSIVERHHGQIQVQTSSKGTQFTISFPVSSQVKSEKVIPGNTA